MSKSKKNYKTTNHNQNQTVKNSFDQFAIVRLFFIGAITAGIVSSVFIGIFVGLRSSLIPFNYFMIPGVFAGILGAFTGSSIYRRRGIPGKSDTLSIILGAFLASLVVCFVVFLFLI